MISMMTLIITTSEKLLINIRKKETRSYIRIIAYSSGKVETFPKHRRT